MSINNTLRAASIIAQFSKENTGTEKEYCRTFNMLINGSQRIEPDPFDEYLGVLLIEMKIGIDKISPKKLADFADYCENCGIEVFPFMSSPDGPSPLTMDEFKKKVSEGSRVTRELFKAFIDSIKLHKSYKKDTDEHENTQQKIRNNLVSLISRPSDSISLQVKKIISRSLADFLEEFVIRHRQMN